MPDFFTFGKILSHGYVLTGYFPLCLSLVCATYLICGINRVSDEVITYSFFNFIDPTEARALKLCLSHNGSPEDMHDISVSMFSRFSCTTIPTESNLGELVNQVAEFTLFCQPFYALFEM